MTVVLARVDDRLIHGQVTVGWCQHLHPDHLVLADNAVAADPWQSRVYASSVP
ncbi:PTS sugar transporter subunit IIB, partial [bacterium]|nr:PTS sugar transporter subunit IIB [bacterium]